MINEGKTLVRHIRANHHLLIWKATLGSFISTENILYALCDGFNISPIFPSFYFIYHGETLILPYNLALHGQTAFFHFLCGVFLKSSTLPLATVCRLQQLLIGHWLVLRDPFYAITKKNGKKRSGHTRLHTTYIYNFSHTVVAILFRDVIEESAQRL